MKTKATSTLNRKAVDLATANTARKDPAATKASISADLIGGLFLLPIASGTLQMMKIRLDTVTNNKTHAYSLGVCLQGNGDQPFPSQSKYRTPK